MGFYFMGAIFVIFSLRDYSFLYRIISIITVGKARECKIKNDCDGIQNTTCIADPRDGRTRCLCGDYSAPLNGLCSNKFKGR